MMGPWQKLTQILQDPEIGFEVFQTRKYSGADPIADDRKYIACLTVASDVFNSPRGYGETPDAATSAVLKLYEAQYGRG